MITQLKDIWQLFFSIIVLCFCNVVLSQNTSNDFVVVLDAGHGGHDPGKHSKYGYKEKDIALNLTLKVGHILEKSRGIKVIYTRKKDVFIALRERARIANQADADLFVSIHCNAHHSEAFGTETFVLGVANTKRNFDIAKQENEVIFLEENFDKNYQGYDPNQPESLIGLTLVQEEYVDQSIRLASFIENNFVKKSKRKSRGVKQASLWVMHNTYMPSVLVETGFVTNKSEGAFLNSKKGQTNISHSIAEAIIQYKSTLDYNIGDSTLNQPEKTHTSVEGTSIVEHDTLKQHVDTLIVAKPFKSEQPLDSSAVKTSVDTTSVPSQAPKISFKVQIASGSNPLETIPSNFNGLEGVSRIKKGDIYKYYYGETSSYETIKTLKTYVRNKGYKSAFIVAYKGLIPISIKDALETINQ